MFPIMNLDARTLSREALSDLRRRGVAGVQNGQTPDEVAQALCVSRAAVFNWLAMYRAGGWQALEARTRGGRLMEQLGLSAQRPLWRAYQQNPKAVSKWLKDEYPRICAEAERRGALVFFGDEAGVPTRDMRLESILLWEG